MSFYESINHALFSRIEDASGEVGTLETALVKSDEYREAFIILQDTLSELPDRDAADRAATAARRLFDLYTSYFYRVGLQDGVKLTAADFPIRDIA